MSRYWQIIKLNAGLVRYFWLENRSVSLIGNVSQDNFMSHSDRHECLYFSLRKIS